MGNIFPNIHGGPVKWGRVMLAGDIIAFRDFEPLNRFLKGWLKPVIMGQYECEDTFDPAGKLIDID